MPLGCKGSEAAIDGGHLDVLKWLRENGCPWDARSCRAVAGSTPKIRKWIQESGCPCGEHCEFMREWSSHFCRD